MRKSQKWAEQVLVEQSFGYKDENGVENVKTLNVLNVCLSGKALFRKEFAEGMYKGHDMLGMPLDFIVLMGSMGAPDGRFYEMEYTIGEYGMVYRALIQAAKPEEDLQLIIGVLKAENVLPKELKPHRAWLREDIGSVRIGRCSRDEDGEAVFYSGHKEAMDSEESLVQRAVKYGNLGVCIEYYRGDCREVWVPQTCDCSKEKVFVCGVNGDDPAFAQQRAEAMDEMWEHLTEAMGIAQDYGLSYFYIWQKENGKGYEVDCNKMNVRSLEKLVECIKAENEKTMSHGNAQTLCEGASL